MIKFGVCAVSCYLSVVICVFHYVGNALELRELFKKNFEREVKKQ